MELRRTALLLFAGAGILGLATWRVVGTPEASPAAVVKPEPEPVAVNRRASVRRAPPPPLTAAVGEAPPPSSPEILDVGAEPKPPLPAAVEAFTEAGETCAAATSRSKGIPLGAEVRVDLHFMGGELHTVDIVERADTDPDVLSCIVERAWDHEWPEQTVDAEEVRIQVALSALPPTEDDLPAPHPLQ